MSTFAEMIVIQENRHLKVWFEAMLGTKLSHFRDDALLLQTVTGSVEQRSAQDNEYFTIQCL